MEKRSVKQFLVQNNTLFIFLILFLVCSLLSETFLTPMNLRNIGLQQSAPVLVAIGMLFVVLTGGIDLSVGSVMALGASLTAILIRDFHIHYLLAIVIAMLAGALAGSFTGFLVAQLNFQGFVASLAVMTITRGFAFMLTNGTPIKVAAGTLDNLVKKEFQFPIIIVTAVLVVLFMLVQKFTPWGRIVIAIGSNSTAVELAGIRVKPYIVSVYALSGVLSALAGVFIAARSSTGSATVGGGQELDAIAACVIGGASLAGGKGFVGKTLLGALVLALIGNIMNLMSVPSYPQDVIKGFIIIGAVLLQVVTSRTERTV